MSWTGNIAIKSNGKWTESQWSEVLKWPEVEKVWSTTGDWDWWIKLKPSQSDQLDTAEKVAWNLRKLPWIENTYTWWAKEVTA